MILHSRKCCPYGISKFQADILQIPLYYLTTHHNNKDKLINDNTNIIKENKLSQLKDHKFKHSVGSVEKPLQRCGPYSRIT